MLKINDKFLSFILIPLINSFPDIVNYFNSIHSNSIELVLGQLIGTNLIIICLTLGIISCIGVNVKYNKVILIDLVWLFCVLGIFNVILKDGRITKYESIIMAIVYLVHLAYLFQINKNPTEEMVPLNIDNQLELADEYEHQNRDSSAEHWFIHNSHIFIHALNYVASWIIPLDISESNNFWLVWYYFLMALGIYQKFPYVPVLITLTVLSSTLLLKNAGSFLGVFNSIIVVSNISILLLKLLKNYGIILGISDYILGFLVFSVANSINDLITNVTLSIYYSPIIGINSCVGTPILLILIGIGYNSLTKPGSLKFNLKLNFFISSLSIMVMVGLLIILIPLNNWKFDRKVGGLLIGAWLVVSVVNCILE